VVSSIPYKRGEATVTSSPVIVGEIVYFGASDGYFYALEVNSGSMVWRYRLGVPIASTAAVSGNAILVAAWDGTVYAFTTGSNRGNDQ
jgi:outer membrane protein assembly factor BamB